MNNPYSPADGRAQMIAKILMGQGASGPVPSQPMPQMMPVAPRQPVAAQPAQPIPSPLAWNVAPAMGGGAGAALNNTAAAQQQAPGPTNILPAGAGFQNNAFGQRDPLTGELLDPSQQSGGATGGLY